MHAEVEPAMMDDRITIKVADNGFVLEYSDPKIAERNRKSDEGFEDPEVNKVYPNVKSLLAGVKAAMSVVTGEEMDSRDEFEEAFTEAMSND